MNIVINRHELLKNFQIVDIASVNDKAEYAKSGLLLEAKDNKLTFKLNGDGIYVISEAECIVKESGSVNIRHLVISDFLKQLDDEEIEIVVRDNSLSILTPSEIETSFAILEMSTENDIPLINSEVQFKFNRLEFLEKLEKVKFAASNKPELEYLNCVRLEVLENTLKLISTDSYRLMYFEQEIENSNLSELKVNIPLKTVDSLIKVLKMVDDEVIYLTSEGVRISFKFSHVTVYSKIVEMQFPSYESIFVALQGNKELIIDINSFKQLLKRLQVFERQEKSATVIFEMQKNKLTASISNQTSKFKESIGIVYDDEEKIRISLTVKYILEFLNTLKQEEVLIIRMENSDRKPVAMFVKHEKEKVYYFLMPTRIQG